MINSSREHIRHNVFAALLLSVATGAASALFMLFFAENIHFLSDWQQPAFPIGLVCSFVMLIAIYFVWRRWWIGALGYLAAAVVIILLMSSLLTAPETSFYADGLNLLLGAAIIGAISLVAAALADAGNFRQRMSLHLWTRAWHPDWTLALYVLASLFLLFVTYTGRFRPFHNLLDRPFHGQDILTEDMVLAGVALLNQVILMALLLGQRWSVIALVSLIVLDMVLTLASGALSIQFIVLRSVAIGLALFVYERNKAFFEKAHG